MREAGRKQVIIGLAIAGVGLIVTLATYSAASNGGSYFIFWGAIIFGLIRAGRGYAMMRRASATPAPAVSSDAPPAPPVQPGPGAVQVEPASTPLPAPPPKSMWE